MVTTSSSKRGAFTYLLLSLLILLFFAIFITYRVVSSDEVIKLQIFLGVLILLASYFRKYRNPEISGEKMTALGLIIVACDILGTYQITDNGILSISLGVLWGVIITISSYVIILYNKSKYLQNKGWNT